MEFNYNNPLEQKETRKHLIVVNGLGEKQKHVGDCVIRSISIACETPYLDVQKELQKRTKAFREKSWSRMARKLNQKKTTDLKVFLNKVMNLIYFPSVGNGNLQCLLGVVAKYILKQVNYQEED